jgi:hypothetical protein
LVILIVLVHGRRVENGYAMNSKLIIVAIALGIAGTNAAHARDVTSDPDATVTSEQKLGPNVRSQRVGNRVITTKTGSYRRHTHYRVRH